MLNSLKKLIKILRKEDKAFLKLLLIFSVIISIIEMVGISIIMPFIAVASNFELVHTNSSYNYFYKLFDFERELDFVILFGSLLICFYFFRSGINLFFAYMQAKFTSSRYHLLVYRLFENYLGMSYKNFVKKNSSVLTKAIVTEAGSLTMVISAYLLIVTEVFVLIVIYGMMLFINIKITLLVTLFLLLNALLLTKSISTKIKQSGVLRDSSQQIFYEVINKSFANFKLIKLQNNTDKTIDEFSLASLDYSKSNVTYNVLSQVPRFFLEAIGFGLIVFIIIFFIWEKQIDINSILPTITMFVLALYRLMPSVNRIMTSYNQINFQHRSLEIIHNDLMYESEILGKSDLSFKSKISLIDIDFAFNDKHPLFNGLNIEIKHGEKIAFIGESGSGKSTLVDIIIGLHKPLSGKIYIDNNLLNDSNVNSWREKIGYIPQTVYLFDGTVAENIVFGREYNEKKLIEVLKKSNIHTFLQGMDGLNTLVGENGVMLSGGQKQRIAIARALYGNPEILVLDEATSALDDETEANIMDEIYLASENKTLIIIAHRLSTINRCNKIYTLDKGKIIE